MYDLKNMKATSESINIFQNEINDDNYKLVFNDFISLFSNNKYLKHVVSFFKVYNGSQIFEEKVIKIKNKETFKNIDTIKDDKTIWYFVDDFYREIYELDLDLAKRIMIQQEQYS